MQVANRRAWAHPHGATPELLVLYRRPLHVLGWDAALVEVARCRTDVRALERGALLATVAAAGLPLLVATGEADPLVPPAAAARLVERLGTAAPRLAVIQRCGHLSHEEAPAALVDRLSSFARGL